MIRKPEDDIVTQLGFVLDQRACIGCHACTVACKTENAVELGVFRTWVKYVEHGAYPDTQRGFGVMRCNQCTDAPCVRICPVGALFKREDGIVDFEPDRCIGCKACMNACPYDALYIDPADQTAAKCNFCAHRVDDGLAPACEVACPTQAIISGDLDDPESRVSRIVRDESWEVRAPEQRTGPNVFYLGADHAVLDPLAVSGTTYLTTEMPESQRAKLEPLADGASATATTDIEHPPPWGWRVSSYFLSKGVAAGAMMLAPWLDGLLAGLIALAGIAVTGGLLVWDLKRPERFYRLFSTPQWGSWLALGAQAINFAAVVAFLYTLATLADADGLAGVLAWVMVPAGALLAGYTALLFNQCEGRDLWQSPLLLPHTLINALTAGAAVVAIAEPGGFAAPTLAAATVISAAIGLLDAFKRHPTGQAHRAALNLRRDRFARRFWIAIALSLIAAPVAAVAPPIAGVLALAGLWLYEDAWVRAGQSVPLS